MINLISLGLVLLAVFWSGYTCCSFSFEVATALQCAATADLARRLPLSEGGGGVGFASQGTGSPEWMLRQAHLSPCYTTRWEDLPVAR